MRASLLALLLLLLAAAPALAEESLLIDPSEDEPGFMSADPADSFFGSAPSPLGGFGDNCPAPGESDGGLRLDCPAQDTGEIKLSP